MANVDNGRQQITFKYQQEGTAEGFNKLLAGVIPTGIISGGELDKDIESPNTVVKIKPMEMLIGDGNVVVHVKTEENATVTVSTQYPYVVATFNWANLSNNYVNFESVNYNTLTTMSNAIVFGKCEFTGTDLISFDYTRKSWSPSYFNNDFQSNGFYGAIPNFLVTCREDENALGFDVGIGKAIIDGKEVEIGSVRHITLNTTTDTSDLYFNPSISNGRIDIAVLKNDGNIKYIMGKDEINPETPIFPSYGLVLAKFEFYANVSDNYIKGSHIKYIYNNNYIASSSTIGTLDKNGNTIDSNTLYL